MTLTAERAEVRRLLQETVREFARRDVAPRAAEIDRTDTFPWDLYRRLGELGLLGMTLPPEYGGEGLDNVSLCLALEELAAASATLANAALLAKIQGDYLLRNCDERQKRRYLPPLARGEEICLIAATEPGTGSDVAAIETTAVRRDGGWVLNGEKVYITSGLVGAFAVVIAKTDPGAGHRGLSAFIVERDTPGFSAEKSDEFMGMRGLGTSSLRFDDCFVPAENLIGEENGGFSQAMHSFNTGRIVIATLALGITRAALEESRRYAEQRHAFGQPIGDFQAVQFMLADMATEVEAARLLIHQAARLKDEDRPFAKEASMAKLFASDAAQRAATNAVQIHGGYGYTKAATVERLYRDSKLTQIYEGTNQIQRLIIARHLRREPLSGA
jgi:alkylation response protein AidB-like acyl-CoA dehydrogenase